MLRTVGEHPADKKPVTLNKGRFGPYVKHGSIMASLSKKQSPDDLTLDATATEALRAKQRTERNGNTARKTALPTPVVENGVTALRTDLTVFATRPAAAAE